MDQTQLHRALLIAKRNYRVTMSLRSLLRRRLHDCFADVVDYSCHWVQLTSDDLDSRNVGKL